MKEKLEQILVNLKAIGVSVSKVETDLGFSNGLLGKVKNGKSNLSDEKFGLVESYYEKLISKPEAISEIKPKTEFFKEPVTMTFGIIPSSEPIVIIPEEMPNSHIKVPEAPIPPKTEKVVLPKASGIMMGADYLAALPKTTFQNLLIEFNSLIEEQPPIKQVEGKLYELIEKSQHPDLNARQSEAIRSRCINYLTGQYGKKKQI